MPRKKIKVQNRRIKGWRHTDLFNFVPTFVYMYVGENDPTGGSYYQSSAIFCQKFLLYDAITATTATWGVGFGYYQNVNGYYQNREGFVSSDRKTFTWYGVNATGSNKSYLAYSQFNETGTVYHWMAIKF